MRSLSEWYGMQCPGILHEFYQRNFDNNAKQTGTKMLAAWWQHCHSSARVATWRRATPDNDNCLDESFMDIHSFVSSRAMVRPECCD